METIQEELIEQIIDSCQEQLNRSYCVYSKFSVGAVLLTDCGKTFTGCNVENASYGLTICAERTAIVKAVSEGHRNIRACFVTTRIQEQVAPCGACRQVLAEFNPDMEIYLIGGDRKYKRVLLSELLPMAFTPADLKKSLA